MNCVELDEPTCTPPSFALETRPVYVANSIRSIHGPAAVTTLNPIQVTKDRIDLVSNTSIHQVCKRGPQGGTKKDVHGRGIPKVTDREARRKADSCKARNYQLNKDVNKK